jgi:hypothetical protein
MDEAVDPKWLKRQRRILAAGSAAAAGGRSEGVGSLESAGEEPPPPHADDVLARVDRVMREMPEREIGEAKDFRKALDTLYRFGKPALAKLAGPAALSPDEGVALEAIIETDGSRPSFLLEQGLPPLAHPFLRDWENEMVAAREPIRAVAAAVGRVQPTGGDAGRFVGTATLFQADPPRALTNYHVLDDARARHGVAVAIQGHKATVGPGLEVDFAGEATSFDSHCFKVVGADLPENYGRGFGHVDAAVLHLEAPDPGELPAAFTRFSALPAYATGGLASLCTIGFPGPPRVASSGEVDWNWVIATLFNNLFGYKRLAPGEPLPGSLAADTIKVVTSHDATTFGGASGSLVLAWNDPGAPAFGLHFGGVTGEANYMVSTARAAAALRKIGVPVQ